MLAPDLLGIGETSRHKAPGSRRSLTPFLGVQTGRSIVGIRAGDITRCVRYLEARPDIDGRRIAQSPAGP